MNSIIRPYSPADRDAIRHICCETGFSGNPVDPLFCDREVFADFFTRYYTDWEPESTLIVEDEGKVVGYLTGCCRYRYHAVIQTLLLIGMIIPKVAWRWMRGQYDADSRSFLLWCLRKGRKQTPLAPRRAAHFHFNLLPDYRNAGLGHRLMKTFVDTLASRGINKVYGQIQTGQDRRPERVFERYGFKCYDKREVTKFRPFHDKTVYVSTVVKEL